MQSLSVRRAALSGLSLILTIGCILPAASRKALEAKATEDIAWQEMETNTQLHDRANWQAVDVKKVGGAQVSWMFDPKRSYPYCTGTKILKNKTINEGTIYWLVRFKAVAMTPVVTPPPPTAPPAVPESFLYEAGFLIHQDTSAVLARYYNCAIY